MSQSGLQPRRWQREVEWKHSVMCSRHVRDLLTVGIAVVFMAFVLISWVTLRKVAPGKSIPVIAGVAGWILAQLWERGKKRLNLVSIFASEILSFLELIKRSKLVDAFFSLYENPFRELRGFAGGPRASDYFQIYESNNSELGFLRREAVANITEFYTYLKGARDAAEALSKWGHHAYAHAPLMSIERHAEEHARRQEVINVLLHLEVMTIAGIKALRILIDAPSPESKEMLKHACALREDLCRHLNRIVDASRNAG